MEGVLPYVYIRQDLIVQLRHSVQKLLLYFLFRDIDGVKKCDYITALWISMVSEARPAPKSTAADSFPQKFKMEICLTC